MLTDKTLFSLTEEKKIFDANTDSRMVMIINKHREKRRECGN